MRWNNYQKKLDKNYMFKFYDKNYAKTKPDKVEEIAPTLPRINYTKKSTVEIHLAINQSLS